KTAISYEFPKGAGEPYYPILTGENVRLCRKYRELAEREAGVFFVG
ncbi:MAG: UDP-galactopyranose mutase, partial [Deltaproteobacteria bacterium]|nr:UDP-galactopyranose mutase [Deltaproteobacteria bacterium]NIS78263.1 UDP-galactopyranose mutase [Deltaproteobacteria bacterium]